MSMWSETLNVNDDVKLIMVCCFVPSEFNDNFIELSYLMKTLELES